MSITRTRTPLRERFILAAAALATVLVCFTRHGACAPPWPHLAATPPMGWNGWLPTTRGLIPGYTNNETMYSSVVPVCCTASSSLSLSLSLSLSRARAQSCPQPAAVPAVPS